MRTALVVGLLAIPAGVADAHIHLLEPLSRTDNAQGDPQKQQHCGDPATTRIATRVTTFKPGQTITVKWAETIPHPGYFRISFQPNGEMFRIPKPDGATGFPKEDLTGMVDPDGSGSIILKDQIADGTTQIDVTLPDMECSNCTLQFIQVMTDKAPYTTDLNSDDIYFNCADITLAKDAPDAGMQPTPDAGVDEGGGNNNAGNGEISSSCSTGNATGLGVLALLGLVGLRRRRRA